MFFLKATFYQSLAKKPNSWQKYLKLQKSHDFFLLPIGFDVEYLFLILRYLHRENDGGVRDDDGHVRGDVRECEHLRHDDVHENEYGHRDDGVYGGFLPFWLR